MTKLKKARQAAGLSQSQLAEAVGISFRTLQEFDQGRKPINKAAAITVYKLAKVLGVSYEDLLEDIEKSPA